MSEDTNTNIEADNWLPHGEQLRILLGSDYIAYGEIAAILRGKGVFCAQTDKAQTIPVLASSVLLPTEFVALLEKSISRESKPKEQPQEIRLVAKDSDWQNCIKSLGGELVNMIDLDHLHGVSFTSNPSLTFDGTNSAIIQYSINRRDYSQDLLKRDLNFTAKIAMLQNGDSIRLEVVSQHSSKETQRINDQLIKSINDKLKNEGISASATPKKILFGSFDNKNRILFLLRLAADFGGNKIPGTIVDTNIRRNEHIESIPDGSGIKWMEGAVRNLKIDGDKLNNIILFAEDQHHEYFFITKLVVEYVYDIGPLAGSCTVIYGFDRIKNIESIAAVPFMYSLDRITPKGTMNSKSLSELRQNIVAVIRKEVDKLFVLLGNDTKVAPTAP